MFTVNNGGSDGTGCFEINLRTKTANLVCIRIERFRQSRNWLQRKAYIKGKASFYINGCKVVNQETDSYQRRDMF